jgi:hypothetical protein
MRLQRVTFEEGILWFSEKAVVVGVNDETKLGNVICLIKKNSYGNCK